MKQKNRGDEILMKIKKKEQKREDIREKRRDKSEIGRKNINIKMRR